MRSVIGRIEANSPAGIPGRLGVTSALSGEGVSTTCTGLTAVLAREVDRQVCQVDLNWPWDDSFDDQATGIADVVDGRLDLTDVIRWSTVDRSAFVSSGRSIDRGRHALARSPALSVVVDDLAARFDHLVIDLPAVVDSDTLALARMCDALLLVVRQGVTTESQVRAALHELRGSVVIGAVLNGARSSVPGVVQRLIDA